MNIEQYKDNIIKFCKKWLIAEFALFGSALREDFSESSDVDVLVDFDPRSQHTLFDLVEMQQELKQLFDRQVDLLTRKALDRMRNRYRKDGIEASLRTIHAA